MMIIYYLFSLHQLRHKKKKNVKCGRIWLNCIVAVLLVCIQGLSVVVRMEHIYRNNSTTMVLCLFKVVCVCDMCTSRNNQALSFQQANTAKHTLPRLPAAPTIFPLSIFPIVKYKWMIVVWQ